METGDEKRNKQDKRKGNETTKKYETLEERDQTDGNEAEKMNEQNVFAETAMVREMVRCTYW